MVSDLPHAVTYIIVGSTSVMRIQPRSLITITFKYQSACSYYRASGYLGSVIDENGYRLDPNKITAFQNLPAPSNKPTLQSILDMINYYNNFAPIMQWLSTLLNNPLD